MRAAKPSYCLCHHKLRCVGWNSQFARLIHELNLDNSNPVVTIPPVNQSSLLKQIEKFIQFDTFVCRSRESELNAAQALLTLWAKLLQAVVCWWKDTVAINQSINQLNHSPARKPSPRVSAIFQPSFDLEKDQTTNQQVSDNDINSFHSLDQANTYVHQSIKASDLRLIFQLIDSIINRHEFDLIHLLPPNQSTLSTPSSNLTNPAKLTRAHSVTVPRDTHKRASSGSSTPTDSSVNQPVNSPSERSERHSNTVPGSSSSHHSNSHSTHPIHPTWLSHAEQLHLFQSYRQLLQSTVLLMLKIVRESQEGRAELAVINQSDSIDSPVNESDLSSTLSEVPMSQQNDWDMLESSHISHLASLAISATATQTFHNVNDNKFHDSDHHLKDPDISKESNDQLNKHGDKLTDSIDPATLELEKEAALERTKVEEMKPDLTVVDPLIDRLIDHNRLTHQAQLIDRLVDSPPISPPISPPMSPPSPHTSLSNFSVPTLSRSIKQCLDQSVSPSISPAIAPSAFSRTDFVWFAGRLLALAFFRLPVLSGPLLDSLSASADHSSKQSISQLNSPTSYLNNQSNEEWRANMLAQVDEYASAQQKEQSMMRKSPSISSLAQIQLSSINRTVMTNSPITPTRSLSSNYPLEDDGISLVRSATLPVMAGRALSSTSVQSFGRPVVQNVVSLHVKYQRQLTAAFLAANPSFFEWTKPELNRDTQQTIHQSINQSIAEINECYARERRWSEESTASSTTSNDSYQSNNAMTLSFSDDDLLTEHNLACIRLLLNHSVTFFVFASAYLTHVQRTANPVHISFHSASHLNSQSNQLKGGLPPFASPERREMEAQTINQTTNQAVKQSLDESISPSVGQSSSQLTAPSDGILWNCVPGYRELSLTFMKRLIQQPLSSYLSEDDDEDDDINNPSIEASDLHLDDRALRRLDESTISQSINQSARALRAEESMMSMVKQESIQEAQLIYLSNSQFRSTCLSWFTELTVRSSSVTNKCAVDQCFETLDAWFTAYLTSNKDRTQAHLITQSLHQSMPTVRLSARLLQSLGPLTANTTLPWIANQSACPQLFLAQMRERSLRARHYSLVHPVNLSIKQPISNPSMSYPFPPNFCATLLIDALVVCVKQEQFQLLLKCCTFLYMHTGHFDNQTRKQLFDCLFDRSIFPRLFNHWCAEIRRVFHSLLVYRVSRDGRMPGFVPGGEPVQSSIDSFKQTIVIGGEEKVIPVISPQKAIPPTITVSQLNQSIKQSLAQSSNQSNRQSNDSNVMVSTSVSPISKSPSSSTVTRSNISNNNNQSNKDQSITQSQNPANGSIPSADQPLSRSTPTLRRKLSDEARPPPLTLPDQHAHSSNQSSKQTKSQLMNNQHDQFSNIHWWTRFSSSLWSLIDPSYTGGMGDYPANMIDRGNKTSAQSTQSAKSISRTMSDNHLALSDSNRLHSRSVPNSLNHIDKDQTSKQSTQPAIHPATPQSSTSHDSVDSLRPSDPQLHTCAVVRTWMDRESQELDATLLHTLDTCLMALHQQYYNKWQDKAGTQPNKPSLLRRRSRGDSPSLRVPTVEPPHSDVLEYQPHLQVYAPAAFREFRSILASFRRVQSQLSTSLAVPSNVMDSCLLPAQRLKTEAGGPVRVVSLNEQARANELSRRSSTGSKAESLVALSVSPPGRHRMSHHDANPAGASEKEMQAASEFEIGYEGNVLVPQLYYSLPA